MKIPNQVRYFNKRLLNPLMARLARAPLGPLCIIHHVGRRSGKPYRTPIFAFPIAEGFVIALTYGEEVDWYRNVRAAGRCQIEWRGKLYEINRIQPLEPKPALALLPAFFRTLLRLIELRGYVKMVGQSPRSA